MLKRLFRIAILLILLLWLSRYTSIFDNTKIKPYFDRVDLVIEEKTQSIKKRWNGSWDNKSTISNTWDNEILSITWAHDFNTADMLEGSWSVALPAIQEPEEELTSTGTQQTYKEQFWSLRISNCLSPWGRFVPVNGYIIAYESPSSPDCKWEKRTCVDGKLSGSYQYDTCYYTTAIANQKQASLLEETEIQSLVADYGSFGIGSSNNTTTIKKEQIIWKEVDAGIIVSSSSDQTNQITRWEGWFYDRTTKVNMTSNDPDKHYIVRTDRSGEPYALEVSKSIAILANGQTELNNHVLKSRSLKRQVHNWGETYFSNEKSLVAKGSYEGKFCSTPRGSLLSNWQYVIAFHYAQAVNGSCELETRFCIDGILQGSFTNEYCEGWDPQLITHFSALLTNSVAVSAGYIQSENSINSDISTLDLLSLGNNPELDLAADSKTHEAASRGCNDQTFGYVPHGKSIIAYNSMCQAQWRICNLGNLQGSLKQTQCH